MILFFRKRTLIFAGAFLCFFLAFFLFLREGTARLAVFSVANARRSQTVVIDAGHGGEDGGASSQSGVKESGINLAVAEDLENLLRFFGVRTVMTRRTDAMIGGEDLPTIRARKVADIRRRVEIVNEAADAVLLSVHQNSLPSSPQTYGAQAFYNGANGSDALADAIQSRFNLAINTHREKTARKIDSSVYLMTHVKTTAVLSECGFLSNAEEAGRLQTHDHQMKLAAAIACGYLAWRAGEDAI